MDQQDSATQEKESRRESWFVLAFVILVFVIVWLFWTYWGGRDTEVAENEPAAATAAVPDVIGLDEDDAISALEDAGFVADAEPTFDTEVEKGTVTGQSPGPGLELELGSLVSIDVATDFGVGAGEDISDDRDPLVPDVTGKLESYARDALEDAGFSVSARYAEVEPFQKDAVYEQSPAGGERAPFGSQVIIRVSTGPQAPGDVVVPDCLGLTEDEAISSIQGRGLVAEVLRRPGGTPGKVYDQFPIGGDVVSESSIVHVLVGD